MGNIRARFPVPRAAMPLFVGEASCAIFLVLASKVVVIGQMPMPAIELLRLYSAIAGVLELVWKRLSRICSMCKNRYGAAHIPRKAPHKLSLWLRCQSTWIEKACRVSADCLFFLERSSSIVLATDG